MEDYLSDYCVNYGTSFCKQEVSKWRCAQEIKAGEDIPIKPLPRELNPMCKACDSLLLREKPDICPFCGDKRLSLLSQISGGWAESEEGIKPFKDVYFCKNCKNKLSVDVRAKE